MFEEDPEAVKYMADLIAMQAKTFEPRGGSGSAPAAAAGPAAPTQVRGKRKEGP